MRPGTRSSGSSSGRCYPVGEMRHPRRPRLRPVAALIALIVLASMLAIGTVHVLMLVVIAPAAFIAAALVFRQELSRRSAISIPPPAAVAAALAGYTIITALPLPLAWLSRLAPQTADIWARALLPFGEAAPRCWAPDAQLLR